MGSQRGCIFAHRSTCTQPILEEETILADVEGCKHSRGDGGAASKSGKKHNECLGEFGRISRHGFWGSLPIFVFIRVLPGLAGRELQYESEDGGN